MAIPIAKRTTNLWGLPELLSRAGEGKHNRESLKAMVGENKFLFVPPENLDHLRLQL